MHDDALIGFALTTFVDPLDHFDQASQAYNGLIGLSLYFDESCLLVSTAVLCWVSLYGVLEIFVCRNDHAAIKFRSRKDVIIRCPTWGSYNIMPTVL